MSRVAPASDCTTCYTNCYNHICCEVIQNLQSVICIQLKGLQTTSDKCYEAPLSEIPLAVQNANMLDLLSVGDHCCRNCSGMQFILVPAPPQTNR